MMSHINSAALKQCHHVEPAYTARQWTQTETSLQPSVFLPQGLLLTHKQRATQSTAMTATNSTTPFFIGKWARCTSPPAFLHHEFDPRYTAHICSPSHWLGHPSSSSVCVDHYRVSKQSASLGKAITKLVCVTQLWESYILQAKSLVQ